MLTPPRACAAHYGLVLVTYDDDAGRMKAAAKAGRTPLMSIMQNGIQKHNFLVYQLLHLMAHINLGAELTEMLVAKEVVAKVSLTEARSYELRDELDAIEEDLRAFGESELGQNPTEAAPGQPDCYGLAGPFLYRTAELEAALDGLLLRVEQLVRGASDAAREVSQKFR
jgi:hypothetical protein